MNHKKTVLRLLLGAAATLPAMVHAQIAPAATASVEDASEEIVVTAQRRSERLIDVPASVSVISASQLNAAGISGSRDLRLLTPGLNITQQGTFVQPTIRGVGTTVTGTGADPNVAIYVDGVYIASQGAALMEFSNVEQIEVLKGPQGTLYGRNATGGAIVVTTRDPSLTESRGDLDVSYGNLNEIRASGYANLVLGSKVAVNIAAYARSNDGYTRNVALNRNSSITKSRGVRGKLLFEATDNLRFVLTVAHVYQEDNTAYSYVPLNNNTPQRQSVAAAISRSGDKNTISLNNDPINTLDFTTATLHAGLTGDWGELTSITSYAYTKYPFLTDLDGTEINVQSFKASPQTQETTTQELIYTSPKWGAFQMVGGLFYYRDNSATQAQISVGGNALPFPPFRPFVRVAAEAFAVYAEGTVDITPDLHLTAGGRFSTETKKARNNDGGANGVLMLDASQKFDAFTPRAALRYDLTDKSSVYASYSQGFKSGLFDGGATGACTTITSPNCPSPGVAVQPEKVRAYEVGYKYNVGSTIISAAAYYSTYKNIQINALNAINQQVLYNAAAGEIYGAELDISANVTSNLNLHVGGAYTHGQYTDFPLAQNFVPLPNGGNAQSTGDNKGFKLIRTPEWTGFVSGTYTHSLPVGELEANLIVSYSDSFFWHVGNRLKQPAFAIVNGRLSWAVSESLKLTVFGDNLTNQRTQLYVREATVGDFASYSRPRTYGFAVSAKF
jgi:iron complex outermembrane receptor protein